MQTPSNFKCQLLGITADSSHAMKIVGLKQAKNAKVLLNMESLGAFYYKKLLVEKLEIYIRKGLLSTGS